MKYIYFIYIFLFIFASSSFAARSITIASPKTTLFGFEDVVITASPSGFTDNETIYIKGAFYQEGSTNYFGYTKKDDSWIKNGESTTSQKQINVNEWDQALTVKSDFEDSGYKGEGDYKFKVGFYYITSGGNLSSVNWSSNILDMNINEPDPTPTPTPQPTPTPTPTSIPTSTPSPTPTKTPASTPSSTPTPITKVTITPKVVASKVLGESTKSAEKTLQEDIELTKSTNILPKVLILLGTVFAAACGTLMYWRFWKKR